MFLFLNLLVTCSRCEALKLLHLYISKRDRISNKFFKFNLLSPGIYIFLKWTVHVNRI